MNTIRTTIATLCAARAEARAKQIRRELRDLTRTHNAAARRADKRARGLRLFIAWSNQTNPGWTAAPRTTAGLHVLIPSRKAA